VQWLRNKKINVDNRKIEERETNIHFTKKGRENLIYNFNEP
jgi:hypothetical protein